MNQYMILFNNKTSVSTLRQSYSLNDARSKCRELLNLNKSSDLQLYKVNNGVFVESYANGDISTSLSLVYLNVRNSKVILIQRQMEEKKLICTDTIDNIISRIVDSYSATFDDVNDNDDNTFDKELCSSTHWNFIYDNDSDYIYIPEYDVLTDKLGDDSYEFGYEIFKYST